jgi:hypothetical protein
MKKTLYRIKSKRLALAVVLLGTLTHTTPAAASIEEATVHFARADQLYREGAFEAALLELEIAYKAEPTYKLLFNIAQCRGKLNDYVGAVEHYQRYLAEGGSEVPQARQNDVRSELQRLANRIGFLEIRISGPAGAEVSVDDHVLSAENVRTKVAVSMGHRKVTVSVPGGAAQTQDVQVAGNATVRVNFRVEAPSEARQVSKDTSSPLPSGPPPRYNNTPVWIGVATTGTLLVASGVFGAIALKGSSSYQEALKVGPNNREAIDSARLRMKTAATVSDVLLGAGAAASLVTILMYSTRSNLAESKVEPVAVKVWFTGNAAGLRGSF